MSAAYSESLKIDLRQEADYDFDADISIEVATNVVNSTKEFYQYALSYLKTLK